MEKMHFIFLRSIQKGFLEDVFFSKSNNFEVKEELGLMKALLSRYFLTLVWYDAEFKM